jgi:predicted dehydrogenase
MNGKTVRLGVIGAGMWGRMHVRAYAQHPSAELVGICDLDEARARELADTFAIPAVFTSVNELLDEKPDGISVVTPDPAHADIVIEAARRGIHVLVEKPMATTVEECERMIAAAEEHRVHLMVDWHNRWNPAFHHAHRAIRNGELGEIRYVHYRLSDTIYVPTKMLPWAWESSVMLFLGSHSLDTTCWLVGQTPQRVLCTRKEGVLTGMGIDTADMYLTIVDFAEGATAVVENCWILPESFPALIDHKCEIIGTQGVIDLDPTHHRAMAAYTADTPQGFPHEPYPDLFITPEIHGRQLGFAVESIYHFVECLRDGVAPLTTPQDGLLNTRLILAAEESARTGVPVRIEAE